MFSLAINNHFYLDKGQVDLEGGNWVNERREQKMDGWCFTICPPTTRCHLIFHTGLLNVWKDSFQSLLLETQTLVWNCIIIYVLKLFIHILYCWDMLLWIYQRQNKCATWQHCLLFFSVQCQTTTISVSPLDCFASLCFLLLYRDMLRWKPVALKKG